MIKKSRRLKQGFTLIEVMLGITLAAILGVSVFSAFAVGVKLSRRSDQNSDMQNQMRWAIEMLSKEMENMVTYDFSRTYPEKTGFRGTDSKISFMVPVNEELKIVSYYLRKPTQTEVLRTSIGRRDTRQPDKIVTSYQEKWDEYYLVRTEQSILDYFKGAEPEESDEEVVCVNIVQDGLRFQFGHQEKGAEGIEWQGKWENNYNPSHVSFEIEFYLANKSDDNLTIKKDVIIPSGFLGEGKR